MYEIICINGKTIEECAQRMAAILDSYVRGDFNATEFVGSLVVVENSDKTFSLLREVIRK